MSQMFLRKKATYQNVPKMYTSCTWPCWIWAPYDDSMRKGAVSEVQEARVLQTHYQ